MQRTSRLLAAVLGLCLGATVGAGCNLADPSLYEALQQPDGGVGSSVAVSDACDPSTMPFVITKTTTDIRIDTRNLTSAIDTTCGSANGTPGNDAFIAMQVVAGEYWHAHLSVLSRTEDRDPVLYLELPTDCSGRTCDEVSDSCHDDNDEHFGFRAKKTGLLMLGIDDAKVGGGEYMLEVFKPVCGDGVRIHGEACDDGNRMNGDGCDRDCRVELGNGQDTEVESNDDVFYANVVELPTGGPEPMTRTIKGAIGQTCDSDFFSINVPQGGSVHVRTETPSAQPCSASNPVATPFDITLRANDGTSIPGATLPGNASTSCQRLSYPT